VAVYWVRRASGHRAARGCAADGSPDFAAGAIFRVNVVSGAAERVYQHRYGVNAAVRDSFGSIWFTQGTANAPEAAEEQGWAAVDVPTPDGALRRIPAANGRLTTTAQVVLDGLLYANGLAIDERTGHLYVAETTGGRVLRYHVDLVSGRVSSRSVFADLAGDNLELDDAGRLWVASPLANALVVVDTATGYRHTVFQLQSPAQEARYAEFNRRGELRTSRRELLTPDLWMPLPGFLTGVILSADGGPVYVTGSGMP
jgi:DNA-binding beta-propeller fold protein YncE